MYGTWFGAILSAVILLLLVLALTFSAWMPVVGVGIALAILALGALIMSARRPQRERTGRGAQEARNARAARRDETQAREAGGFPTA